jgi:hypothetical protein
MTPKPRVKKTKTVAKPSKWEDEEGSTFSGVEKTILNKVMKEAELGYLSMNLFRPPPGAFWGHFNDRRLDSKWADQLAGNFTGHLDNCVDDKAIPVAIKKEWLKDAGKLLGTVAGLLIKDVPVMEFTEEAKEEVAKDNIWALGGNHRREALTVYINRKLEACTAKQAELERISLDGEDGKDSDTLGALRRDIEILEAEITASTHWVVIVYDRGTCEVTSSPPECRS